MELKKILRLTWILVFLITSIPVFATINISQKNQIQKLLNHWRERLGIPGASMSISFPGYDDPVTFVSGTKTRYGSERITSDTLFQAGSISKSFTSMIVLQLVAEGKIELDNPITKYLPQYQRWHNVTVKQLLNNTSGIFDYTKTARFQRIRKNKPEAQFSPKMIVDIAKAYPSYFPPGKGWKYSNTNYVLAGMIIEAVTKQPVSNTLRFYLHQDARLNLPNTHYLPGIYSQEALEQMAHGYDYDNRDVTQSNMSWAYTAGSITSTTTDLITWWQTLFRNNILPKKELGQMMSLVCEHTSKKTNCIAGRSAPHLTNLQVDKRYGLGIIQSAYGSSLLGTIWWHNGSTQGYKAIVMWFPKNDIYISLMLNRDPGFLLTPNLPIIRNTMHVLLTESHYTTYQHRKHFTRNPNHKLKKKIRRIR